MSGKSQEARADDFVEQIITQGLDQINASARADAEPGSPAEETSPAPEQEDGGKDAASAVRKNKRSAVYLYLLILFGASFLLLLMAYFVQQRSSESTISGLRESMNLSREDFLAEIKELEDQSTALEGQNTALNDELARLSGDLSQWQERYEEKAREADDLLEQKNAAQAERNAWEYFWMLEQSYQAEDYESCAVLLLLEGFGYQVPESAWERHEEIIQAVIDEGILDEDYQAHTSDYDELVNAYFSRQADES